MNGPIKELGMEHHGITLMLEVLKKMANQIEEGREVPKDHLKKVSEFLRVFADKCHHGKEEKVLFPFLLNRNQKTVLVNKLLGEHKTGRDYIKGMVSSIKKYKSGNPDSYHIAGNLKGYVSLLEKHIKKENKMFFAIANLITGNVEIKMQSKFDYIEENVVGRGKHEKYHSWIEELTAFYKTK